MPPLQDADAATLYVLAIAAFQRGEAEAALDLIARACAHPESRTIHHAHHGEILLRHGRAAEAEAVVAAALARDPDNAPAWDLLGTILVNRAALADSRPCFERAIGIDPDFAIAHNNLALVLQRLGELDLAETHYRLALRQLSEVAGIQLNLAILLRRRGRDREGLAMVEAILATAPAMIGARLLAAEFESVLGRDLAALDHLDQAVALAPDQVDALVRRSLMLCRLARSDAALDDSDRALGLAPGNGAALHTRALALQGLDRTQEALDAFALARQAVAEPALLIAHHALLLAELGRKAEALAELDEALRLQPELIDAWYARANLSRYSAGHPDLARMEGLADRPEATPRDRLHLGFALGKAYLDLGDGPRAFARLHVGAGLKRTTIDYDPEHEAAHLAAIADTFSAPLLSRRRPPVDADPRPILVFGMPRSGTTLVEQILASHPAVHGAGESAHLADLVQTEDLIARAPALPADAFPALGRRYLERLGANAPSTARLVDKTPSNFLYAGLIPLILPGARMIHCRRDPLDTCLSIYSLLFTRGHEYSYDLTELGHYYGLYRRLTAHWRGTLPAESVLEIDYEALVREPEAQVRAILDFCGLPWDERCLRFHQTERRVTSASRDQVRAPIHTRSIGRAQPFRPWLQALEAALG
ncbi:tetratricopeptide repeat-containing sulfotransferase family protein [Caulobacter sp. S45]|uniref:tetratricopeptide repeat-containing sulfotransferase family protein n=1 Tax=Caulobacter sp. S45 TaxID=1641861 RepID=UPI00131E094C|nr:tetratricopeptide repeat-containing sulfotransferase family protein [Caulobacter sp. S45]